MGTLVVTSFITLDGVVEAPERWSFPYWNDRIERFKNEELQASAAHLLGRETYETFARAWPSRSGFYADRLNAADKYVVSTTLRDAGWTHTRIVGGFDELRAGMREFKQRHDGDVLVHGSRSLVGSLMQHDLVDTYHLLVYPLVLGQGRRLFMPGTNARLKLASSTEMGSGVMLLVYRREER